MAKEMMSARIDGDLRAALSAEADGERRTVSNMLECILRERYSVLTERGVGRVVEVGTRDDGPDAGSIPAVAVAPRSVSAGSVPPVAHDVPMRQQARNLALRDGKCSADVARGTKCKLCGKVHG